MTPKTSNPRTPKADTTQKRVWRKPIVRVHGDLTTLTRAKEAGGQDSGLGTQVS